MSPSRSSAKDAALKTIKNVMRNGGSAQPDDKHSENARDLALAVSEYTRPDLPDELGALKIYDIPKGNDGAQARKRFLTEIDTLRRVVHRNLLRLVEARPQADWMITEYCEGKTLHEQLAIFKGQPIKTLEYFRGLVDGVAALHEAKAVHRDIKPQNVFVTDGRLVLGDFGIVFVEGSRGETRVTETFERVGTRDWMPPWAHTGMRIDDVSPSFDVFCLGKVLWSMLSGRHMLPFWYFNRDGYDLAKLFPAESAMKVINERLLAKSVVEDEQNCFPDARQLLVEVDDVLRIIKGDGQIVGDDMQCQLCGVGGYQLQWAKEDTTRELSLKPALGRTSNALSSLSVRVYRCTNCGHVAMFHFPDGDKLPGWKINIRHV
jgi:serine/threonine protein kinase